MLLLNVVTLFIVSSVATGALWHGLLPEKPKKFANQEGCYVVEEDKVIPFGSTTYPISFCYRIECSHRALHYASCGTVSTDDPKCYKTDYDLSMPYPECCPTIKCDDNFLS